MQHKDQFIKSLAPYQPLHDTTILKLIEQTPPHEQRELRMALEALRIKIPAGMPLVPPMTFNRVREVLEPIDVSGPVKLYKCSSRFMLAHDKFITSANGVVMHRDEWQRSAVYNVAFLEDGRMKLIFGPIVDDLIIEKSDDELQRIHIFKIQP